MSYDVIMLMLRHSTFYAIIGYANHFMVIFFINLNVRNERKKVIELKGCTYKITHIVAALFLDS